MSMNIFTLKTQINDNPPQTLLAEAVLFDVTSDAEVKESLNYLMQFHFGGLNQELSVWYAGPRLFRYYIGEQVLVDGDVVNKCFTRESVKNCIANNRPLGWDGTADEFKNLILATPDDKLNDFLFSYNFSVPAFDKTTGYRDTLKILRTTAEDTPPLDPNVQYIDAFDYLKAELKNHVTELDNNGFSVAILKDDAIIFTTEAMLVENHSYCIPQASRWSRPITWDMVNHPNSGGYIAADLGENHYVIELETVTNVYDFFEELKRQCNTIGKFILETRTNTDGSVTVRYLPSVTSGNIKSPYSPPQVGQFYTYSPEKIGRLSESVINLADAFESPPLVMNCEYPRDIES